MNRLRIKGREKKGKSKRDLCIAHWRKFIFFLEKWALHVLQMKRIERIRCVHINGDDDNDSDDKDIIQKWRNEKGSALENGQRKLGISIHTISHITRVQCTAWALWARLIWICERETIHGIGDEVNECWPWAVHSTYINEFTWGILTAFCVSNARCNKKLQCNAKQCHHVISIHHQIKEFMIITEDQSFKLSWATDRDRNRDRETENKLFFVFISFSFF